MFYRVENLSRLRNDLTNGLLKVEDLLFVMVSMMSKKVTSTPLSLTNGFSWVTPFVISH